MASVWKELKRRNVVKVAVTYAIVGWLLVQVADTFFPALQLPEWTVTLVAALVILGFPLALILSWAYDLTPQGVERTKSVPASESITEVTGRKLDFAIIGVLTVALLGAGGLWFMGRDARWARDEAFPQIEEYAEAGDSEAAYVLAKQVQAVLPNDPILAELWSDFSWITTIPSDPPGAKVFRRPYSATDAEWEELGTTPLNDIHFPHGLSVIRLELDGRPPLLRVLGGGLIASVALNVSETPNVLRNVGPEPYKLDTDESLPEGMVRVPGWSDVVDGEPTEFREFFLGRYEVTNREFKAFVDAGGYRRRDLWEHEFVQDGEMIPWEEAIVRLTDTTGRPGPSTWEAGSYADGEDDYPVAGVSWYEAAAYARFVGQELPSVHHWRRAFAPGALTWMLPASNLEGDEPAPVGQFQGIGWTGTYDLIGNVREWCLNSRGEQRFILGGGWNDAYYIGQDTAFTQPPLDRSVTNGFRLAITRDEAMAAQRAQQPVPDPDEIPVGDPVSDEEFDAIRRWYAYDEAAPLNATIEATETTRYWTRERITFDAAYSDERVILYLYLPRSGPSRYQTIVHWPGGGALAVASVDQLRVQFDFALKNGRAVAFPVYKGTFDRRLPARPSETTIAGRDIAIQRVKDLRRTIDYLESRGDIDPGALAYYGISWGAWQGSIALALEPRLQVGIFNLAGLRSVVLPPEINVINFLPRVDVPVLQLNGEFDTVFPLETSAIPFFELLGTPAADKKHVVAPGGHFIPTPVIIGETLDWLDKYLGPPSS